MDVPEVRSCLEKEIGYFGGVILEYKVVSAFSDTFSSSCDNLERKVNSLIKLGFKPQGNIQVVKGNVFYNVVQAMIKDG